MRMRRQPAYPPVASSSGRPSPSVARAPPADSRDHARARPGSNSNGSIVVRSSPLRAAAGGGSERERTAGGLNSIGGEASGYWWRPRGWAAAALGGAGRVGACRTCTPCETPLEERTIQSTVGWRRRTQTMHFIYISTYIYRTRLFYTRV